MYLPLVVRKVQYYTVQYVADLSPSSPIPQAEPKQNTNLPISPPIPNPSNLQTSPSNKPTSKQKPSPLHHFPRTALYTPVQDILHTTSSSPWYSTWSPWYSTTYSTSYLSRPLSSILRSRSHDTVRGTRGTYSSTEIPSTACVSPYLTHPAREIAVPRTYKAPSPNPQKKTKRKEIPRATHARFLSTWYYMHHIALHSRTP